MLYDPLCEPSAYAGKGIESRGISFVQISEGNTDKGLKTPINTVGNDKR